MISKHTSGQLALIESCNRGEWELANMLCEEMIKFIKAGGNPGPRNTPERALAFYGTIHKNIKEKLQCTM